MYETGEFADESFIVKHDQAGLLGMCHKKGFKNTNECKFYITLSSPLTHMNKKTVVFGRIVKGLSLMAQSPGD